MTPEQKAAAREVVAEFVGSKEGRFAIALLVAVQLDQNGDSEALDELARISAKGENLEYLKMIRDGLNKVLAKVTH